jgi:hypothetical protein
VVSRRACTCGVSKRNPDNRRVSVKPALGDEDARVWLRSNPYVDIAEQIDRVMLKWKAEGKATRRNWWQILAGWSDGRSRIAGGVTFPVLRAARIRQGLPPDVPGVLCRDPNEKPPTIRVSHRWKPKRRTRKKR